MSKEFKLKKYTRKELIALVNNGAVDITREYSRDFITEPYTKIGYNATALGYSGAVFEGQETGNLYVITSRSLALYIF